MCPNKIKDLCSDVTPVTNRTLLQSQIIPIVLFIIALTTGIWKVSNLIYAVETRILKEVTEERNRQRIIEEKGQDKIQIIIENLRKIQNMQAMDIGIIKVKIDYMEEHTKSSADSLRSILVHMKEE